MQSVLVRVFASADVGLPSAGDAIDELVHDVSVSRGPK
jgi:hypothetical protein